MIREPEEFLEQATNRVKTGDGVSLTVRELLAHWGAKRRGYWIVDRIERDLKAAGLITVPSFTEGWIDNDVALVPVQKGEGTEVTGTVSPEVDIVEAADRALPQVSLTIGSLPSANLGVSYVSPQDHLDRAQSIMMRHDYSQLAVMSGTRNLRGAISWESIAQARIRNPSAGLVEAVIAAEVVRSDDDLLAQIPRIADAGFVFVQAFDRHFSGIVTTADLSNQFATLAKPFLLIAEIERRIRRIIDRAFILPEIRGATDPSDADRPVESADDLTVGEYVRLLENPDRWVRLGWALDRKEFIEALHQMRGIRNDVMHFSPDPLDDEQIVQMQTFLKWLRRLDPEL
jgi:predicted transcriptional regulator